MSACQECGAEIRWTKRAPEEVAKGRSRFNPPLQHVGLAWIIDKATNIAHQTPVYQQHECDPADVRAHATEVVERHQAFEDAARSRLAYQQGVSDAQADATKRNCPKCGAKRGARCKNLSDRNNGKEERETVWPHLERHSRAYLIKRGLLKEEQ